MSTIENGIETGQLLKIIANQQQQINDLRTLLYKVHDIQELNYSSKYKKSHEHLFSQKCIDEIKAKTVKITNTTFNNIYKNLTTDILKHGYHGIAKVLYRELYNKIQICSMQIINTNSKRESRYIFPDYFLYIFQDKIILDCKGKKIYSIIIDIILKKYERFENEIRNLDHDVINEKLIETEMNSPLLWYSLMYLKTDLIHNNIKILKQLLSKIFEGYFSYLGICYRTKEKIFTKPLPNRNNITILDVEYKFKIEHEYYIRDIENCFGKRFKDHLNRK
jgi:hypothetical protein